MRFYSFVFDLDLLILAVILDLDILKMCLYTETKVHSYSGSNVIA